MASSPRPPSIRRPPSGRGVGAGGANLGPEVGDVGGVGLGGASVLSGVAVRRQAAKARMGKRRKMHLLREVAFDIASTVVYHMQRGGNMAAKLTRCAILIALLLVLSGCSVTPDRSNKPSPDWSRGLKLGVASANQPVALQVDGKGHIHLVWYARTEGVGKLHYVQLDEQARVLVDKDLDISMPYPQRPKLLVDKRGNMHLAWIAREDNVRTLFHSLLDAGGDLLSEAIRLSLPGKRVESYQMCLGRDGQIEVFWSAKEGIYHLRLDERGEILSSSTLIISQGINPTVQVDDSGIIHLAWLQEPSPQVLELYYTVFEASRPIEGNKLARFGKGAGVSLHGPVLGLDANNVYIFWSLEKRGGQGAGSASCYCASFPLGRPSSCEISSVTIPAIANPPYISSRGAYNYQRLVPPLGKWSSEFIHMPTPIAGQRSELAVAFSVKVQPVSKAQLEQIEMVQFHEEMFWPGDRGPVAIGFNPQVQLALAIFADGKLKGYQIATRTKAMSLQPNIVVDSASNLHLAWLETAGFRRYNVYYATTSPQAKAWLDRTSPQDVLLTALTLAWGMFSAVAIAPFMVVWIFPPLFWIILFYVFSGQDDLRTRRAQVALGIAVALYLVAKLLLLPGLLFYVPLLEQVPTRFSSALIFGVPLMTLTLALFAVYVYTRRVKGGSLFVGFVVFVLTDALLSLAIYSLGMFGGY